MQVSRQTKQEEGVGICSIIDEATGILFLNCILSKNSPGQHIVVYDHKKYESKGKWLLFLTLFAWLQD